MALTLRLPEEEKETLDMLCKIHQVKTGTGMVRKLIKSYSSLTSELAKTKLQLMEADAKLKKIESLIHEKNDLNDRLKSIDRNLDYFAQMDAFIED